MADLTVKTDIQTQRIEAGLRAAGARAPVAIARALNKTGTPTENAYVRQVKRTLGLKNWRHNGSNIASQIRKVSSRKRAKASSLKYSFAGWGKGLPLAYYQPKETPKGVTVNWLGARKLVPRSFYLSGRFPKRKLSNLSHSVWRRIGKSGWGSLDNLDRPRGPALPEAMVHPVPERVWQRESNVRLPRNLMHELSVIIAGIA